MLPPSCIPHHGQFHDERGFLLVGVSIFILIVTALLGSVAFVTNRDNRFQGNYTTGESLAQLAVAAHFHAQEERYRNSIAVGGTPLLDNMNLPYALGLRPVAGTTFSTDIRGCDLCPLASASATRAASAYVHVRIRSNQIRLPSDNIALLAGAAKRNLARAGFVDSNIPAGDTCAGAPTRVRWGPESSACLNGGHFGTLGFTDIQPGDMIYPVWETALATVDAQAMFRYPQPERGDLNMMTTNLLMQDAGGTRHAIEDAGNVVTRQLQQSDDADIGTMNVRTGSTATQFQDTVTVNNAALNVTALDGQTDPAMSITGNIQISGNATAMGITNVENGITAVGNNEVSTAEIRQFRENTILFEHDSNDVRIAAGTVNADLPLLQQDVSVDVDQLIVLGEVDAQSASTTLSGGIYSSAMSTEGANGNLIRNTATTAAADYGWTVGAIDQRGTAATQGFVIQGAGFTAPASVTASVDCVGSACPDNITDPPPDGGFEN